MSGQDKAETKKPRLIGINHIALEVGNIDEALEFYGKIFEFKLRGKRPGNGFIDMGDQFINLIESPTAQVEDRRHFGLVVDDRSTVRARAEAAGAELPAGPFLRILDPWGNRLEIVEYRDIQFTKAPHVLRGMDLDLDKSETAKKELAEKGLAP
ncbi:MAG: VOC family protein [Stellaceae bacterium]